MPDQTTPRPAVFKINGRPLPYELHPACAAWPLMPSEALRELAADIKANGLRDKLTLTPEGLLLEGQNRMTACALNGDFNPPTEVYEGDDPVGFVISKNKHRRHMEPHALAFVAAELATLKRGAPVGNVNAAKTNPANAGIVSGAPPSSRPAAAIAAEIGIPVTSVENARAVIDKATPEVAALAQAGDVPLRAAADYARHTPKAEQRADPAVIRQAASQPKPRPILNPRPAGSPPLTATATKPEPAQQPLPEAEPDMPEEEDDLSFFDPPSVFWDEQDYIEAFAQKIAEDWHSFEDDLRATFLRSFDALEASLARARHTIEAVAGPQQPRPQPPPPPSRDALRQQVAALQQENATLARERDRLNDQIIWMTERMRTLTAVVSTDPRYLNRGTARDDADA